MTILVTGATSGVGRQVVRQLLLAGATNVRALTTNPVKAALPPEVQVCRGFIGKPASLPAAFDGVEVLYLAPYPDTVQETVALAAAAGVQRIVDLSGPPDSWWHDVAQAVTDSGLGWTHLEPGEFMENATGWAEEIRTTGMVRDGYPLSANAPIAIDDVAAVAAAALLDDRHLGEAYELSGPQTLTRAEMVGLIGVALGREIPYLELDHEQAIAARTPDMGEYARWYVEGMAMLAEHPQQPATTATDILDRPATTFAEWAVANAKLFR